MKKTILLVFVALALTSCNTIMVFHMDVLRPAFHMPPTDNKSFLLVDNSGLQPANFAHSYLEKGVFLRDTTFDTDTLSTLLLESISKKVSEQHFYDQVAVSKREEIPFRKVGSKDFTEVSLLNTSQIHELSDSLKVDFLVSLDQIILQSKTNISSNAYLSAATRDVKVYTAWSAYDVKADSLLYQFQYKDSIYWENFAANPQTASLDLPKMESALPEIADVLAEKLAMIVSPYWENVNRAYYSTGSVRMKYAVDCMRNDDWEGAATLWRDEFDHGFGRSVYRAALNLMLYEEYKHTPDDALGWVDRVDKAMKNCIIGATEIDLWYFGKLKEFLTVRSVEYAKLKISLEDK